MKIGKTERVSRRRSVFAVFAFVGLILTSFLASCTPVRGYGEPEDQYIVSAIGFDETETGLEVSVQTAGVGVEDARLFTGSGDSVEYALGHLNGGDPKRQELSHCAVIVVGDSIGKERLAEILDYCKGNDSITIGARLVAAHNAGRLLSLKDADGYSILSALREGGDGRGLGRGSRFYEIENRRMSGGDGAVYHLPYFTVGEESFFLSGLRIFRTDGAVTMLSETESIFYLMLRDELDGGTADVEYGGRMHSVRITRCKTEYGIDGETGVVEILCRVELDSQLSSSETDRLLTICSEGAEKCLSSLWKRYGDLFGINEVLDLKVGASETVFLREADTVVR